MPTNLKIFLLDIETGSDTRILVKNVQEYLKNNEKEKEIFYETSN
jgi:hypothetical protein